AAHEIGHNFDAPHDGDTGAACASTPQSFLMAPRLNGSQQFSSCSIDQMARLATSGWCLADMATDPVTSPDPPPGGAGPPGGNGDANPEASGGGGPLGLALVLALVLAHCARGYRRPPSVFRPE
ncbi:MAG: M12 family metallo-peptidase, partial [Steroidobacteraceae bacterium]